MHRKEAVNHKPQALRISMFLMLFSAFHMLSAVRYPLLFAQDKIIAIVNKDIITQKDLNDFVNFMRVQLSAQYKGQQLEDKIQSMKSDLLNKLIEDRLILQEARKANITLNPDAIKAKINEIRSHYSSDMEFQEAIAKQGLVGADIEARIKEQSLMYAVIDKEIRSKILIKPMEVTDFYQANTDKFVYPEQLEFESVTIGNASLVFEINNALKSGQELRSVADKYSLSMNRFTSPKDGRLKKEVEDVLYKLKVGEFSPPIKIDNEYYIFKLVNRTPPRKQNLSEVQDDIYAMLYNKRMQEGLSKWLDQLKTHSYIKIQQN